MTQEEKAKAYDNIIEKANKIHSENCEACQICIEELIPELKESENERIRKAIIDIIRVGYSDYAKEFTKQELITWLEKQDEQKPNYCHHEVDLSECSEEYRKAYYDGWNNCNMQHSQCKSELDDVVKCLINGMKFYYEDNKEATWGTDKWSMPVKHIIEVLEKQGEQKPADEPKFKERDWVIIDGETLHITNVTEDGYSTEEGGYIPFRCEKDARLWTIQDAKDGDVLASKDGKDILIFRNIEDNMSFSSYYNIAGKVEHYWLNSVFIPATKEQRDLLFSKMKEAGCEWNADKKELRKIEQNPTWSEEDENNMKEIILFCDTIASGAMYSISGERLKSISQTLKSLKKRYTWKPSDEQMSVIEAVINNRSFQRRHLDSLYADLKKLREE